jgi:ABC-2 type transport system permease protein
MTTERAVAGESPVQVRLRQARHTWRVVRKVSALNLRARMSYRGDFLMSILFGILWQTSTLIFASVLLTRFNGLGNFPNDGVLLIIGMRLLSHGLYVLVFDNLAFLALRVNEGRMDGYFVRPLPVFTQLLMSDFNVNAFGDLAVGATTFGFAINYLHTSWSPTKIGYLVIALIGGVLIEASLQWMLSCLLLRSPSSYVVGAWVDELMSTFGNYPLSILPKVAQGLFTFVLPLAFVAYFPAEVILGIAPHHGATSILVHWSPAAGFLLFVLARWIWGRSLRGYHTAGG